MATRVEGFLFYEIGEGEEYLQFRVEVDDDRAAIVLSTIDGRVISYVALAPTVGVMLINTMSGLTTAA